MSKATELRDFPRTLPIVTRDEDGTEHPEITDNRPLGGCTRSPVYEMRPSRLGDELRQR